jgi:hypothetical protein
MACTISPVIIASYVIGHQLKWAHLYKALSACLVSLPCQPALSACLVSWPCQPALSACHVRLPCQPALFVPVTCDLVLLQWMFCKLICIEPLS